MMQGYQKLSEAKPPLCVAKDEDGMTFESTDLGRVRLEGNFGCSCLIVNN